MQEVLGVRSDLPLDRYRLHPDEVDGVVAIPLSAALALFEGDRPSVAGEELRRGCSVPTAVEVTIASFAAGEVGGYPARALRGLLEVIMGGTPEPFDLR